MADLTYDDVVKIVADEAWGACEACRADPRAILRALSDAGIALVPREADEHGPVIERVQRAIARAARESGGASSSDEDWELWGDEARAAYAAAIAAGEIREKDNG